MCACRLTNVHELPTDRLVQLFGLPVEMHGTDGVPTRVIAPVG